jgi:hypothetical protein
MSADELDSLILQSSIGPAQPEVTDEITKEIEELERQAAPVTTTEIVAAGETAATEEEIQDVEAQAKAEEKVLEDAETAPKTEEQKKADATPPVVSSASTPEQVGTVFNNSEFIDYVANLSKGIAKTGEVGSGLALGSALAAEERSLKDLEKEKADRELLLKAIESLDFKDRKDILTEKRTMNESVRDYNNAVAAQELAKSVIDFANGDKNLASFASKIGATLDDVKSAAGIKDLTKVSQLSNTKRAQIALTILTNRNIKEILGESGRTISNPLIEI